MYIPYSSTVVRYVHVMRSVAYSILIKYLNLRKNNASDVASSRSLFTTEKDATPIGALNEGYEAGRYVPRPLHRGFRTHRVVFARD